MNTFLKFALPLSAVGGAAYLYNSSMNRVPTPNVLPSWPVYGREEVRKHRTLEDRIWVSYEDSVYDITSFLPKHPGGDEKIKMAAGNALEPFWEMYSFHKRLNVRELLDDYKIGTLAENDRVKPTDLPNFDELKREDHVVRSDKLV